MFILLLDPKVHIHPQNGIVPVDVQHLKIPAVTELVDLRLSNCLLIGADGFNKNTRHTSQNVVDQRRKYKNKVRYILDLLPEQRTQTPGHPVQNRILNNPGHNR
jgi:2-polyprenyl-6-methoxyphenol hydroxylase-like FAD-dependent oxidoreductase